jgi:signal transduction histidine kinase
MKETSGPTLRSNAPAGGSVETGDTKMQALDLLLGLIRCCSGPGDFEQMIDKLLLSLCDRVSAGDSFVWFRKPSDHSLNKAFFATGEFKNGAVRAALPEGGGQWETALADRPVWSVRELGMAEGPARLGGVLAGSGVDLVCPLFHAGRFFGLIGLGAKMDGASYTEKDTGLVADVMDAVVPLVAHAYECWDTSRLNSWYLDILDNVRQGVFVFDGDLRLRKINPAGLDILGTFQGERRDFRQVEGRPIGAIFPEGVFDGWARKLVEARDSRRSTAGTSLVARRGDEERIYSLGVTCSSENSGTGTTLIITLDDVTLPKAAEQRLFDLQKLADKGIMASSISHELNNFLGLILGGVELTEFALDSGNAEKAASTLTKLKEHVANMERFTRGLMEFETPRVTKRMGRLKPIIEDVLSFVSVQRRFKGIKIEAEVPDDLPAFPMDGDQISQLMLNLLNNAGDAVREAGVQDGRVTVEACEGDDQVILRVSDNGAGIRPEITDRLFKSRFTTKATGHGYGLMACRNIVADHGGAIDVSSEVGCGSTFTIRFPLRTGPE